MLVALAACSSTPEAPAAKADAGACSVTEQTGCKAEEACEAVTGKDPACFAPVVIEGKVVDGADANRPLAGVRVVARDADGAAASNVAVTGADGVYRVAVPAPRDAQGKPTSISYTLRADAAGYDTFPSGLRTALPIDVGTAVGQPPVATNGATTIALFANGKTGLGSISGTVRSEKPGGTLVVAKGATAIADKAGAYTLFNVEPGSQEVRGYIGGVNFKPARAEVAAGAEAKGVDLSKASDATGKVNGSVNIVNAPGGSVTSVVLAVEDTFLEALALGEVPRGLRAAGVTGAFTFEHVPDGRYVVLAAFENDGLVRDPDPNISGTQILHVTIAGNTLEAGNFKVTEALAVVGLGANEIGHVSGAPTFTWKDDSSETGYHVQLLDRLGTKVWEDPAVVAGKGSRDVTLTYGGPPLAKGGYYQFRVTSMKGTAPISRTEDLRGVFVID